MVVPKFQITPDEIDQLVKTFYARARVDPVIGPVFMNAVGSDKAVWDEHEAKIASFWRNAIGLDRSFSGNPMMKHLANVEILPEHFPTWLALFHKSAEDTLPPEKAASICALADRIGESLQMGLMQFRQPLEQAPRF
ncbi:Group 3 truncated hemoglobin ctb [Cognatishimia activa]|uniref:Group 3 truncated hemoglobin ctb n=1 Tax=Cognatishimia activa TaxID=1715691 RepID=A0A0N7MC86_9RHOB|nr:group III truncated hemoglobin [Cognatishimia activa]CUK27512.1 Group 3 truncated hemoglobin ctb [Cognatishimia activa]